MKKWYQKTWVKVVGALLIIGIIANMLPKKEGSGKPKEKEINISENKIDSLLQKEAKIMQHYYDDRHNTLYVAVKDDRSSRNGYAEYLCQVLAEIQLKSKIKVMEYKPTDDSELNAGHRIILGKSDCNFK